MKAGTSRAGQGGGGNLGSRTKVKGSLWLNITTSRHVEVCILCSFVLPEEGSMLTPARRCPTVAQLITNLFPLGHPAGTHPQPDAQGILPE